MGEEENVKLGLERVPKKRIEMKFDSGDDEPIGSLLKLKSKKNSKKVKVELAGSMVVVHKDEDLVGMDDTLASFKKKLKGPKKDSGSVLTIGKSSSRSSSKLTVISPDGSAKAAGKIVERGQSDVECLSEGIIDKGFEKGMKRKGKRPKVASELKKSEISGDMSLRYDKESGKSSPDSMDGILEDSLSAFLKKTQSGFTKKSLSSLKRGKGSEVLCDVLNSTATETFPSISPSTCRKLVEEIPESNEKELIPLHSDSRRELSSSALLKSSVDIDDASSIEGSQLNVPACFNKVAGVLHGEVNCHIKLNEEETARGDNIAENCKDLHDEDVLKNFSICSEQSAPKDGFSDHSMATGRDISSAATITPENIEKLEFGHPVSEAKFSADMDVNELDDKSQGSIGHVFSQTLMSSASLLEGSPAAKEKTGVQGSGYTQVHLTPDFVAAEKCSSDFNDQQRMSGDSVDEQACAPVSLSKEDGQLFEGGLSPVSIGRNQQVKVANQMKPEDQIMENDDDLYDSSRQMIIDNSVSSLRKCSKLADEKCEGAHHQSRDFVSGDDEADASSSPSVAPEYDHYDESVAEETESKLAAEGKEQRLFSGQRAPRKAKKRRHGDMAYEGDVDWDILVRGQGYLLGHQVGDGRHSSKTREKLESALIVMDIENGGVAAVSVGLKAREVGPVERIKFKEVLKRRGGLLEYLECRNRILSLWNKDISRVLPLSECGVYETPLADESPRASLIRQIYSFLDQCGYINFGIASEKDKAENGVEHNLKILKEEKIVEKSGAPVADTDDGVSFILGRSKSSEIIMPDKNDVLSDEGEKAEKCGTDCQLIDRPATELSTLAEPEECPVDDCRENGYLDIQSPRQPFDLGLVAQVPSSEVKDSELQNIVEPDLLPPINTEIDGRTADKHLVISEDSCGFPPDSLGSQRLNTCCDVKGKKEIIVVGAGPAGLTAARHLKRQGFHVTVLEARSRIGGRVFTDHSSLSVPVDLGASIITGIEADVATERRPDPSSLICAQLGLELTVLNSDCPLYDVATGQKVPADLDETLEAEFNSLLDDMVLLVAQKGEHAMRMSLEDGLEYALKKRRKGRLARNHMGNEPQKSSVTAVEFMTLPDGVVPQNHNSKVEILSPPERRVMDWHFANLEYGCAALLKEVSLPYWNQDDAYGGFGGAHCMIKGGYSSVVESLGEELCVHLNHIVTDISYCKEDVPTKNDLFNKVKVSTSNGREFSGDAVLITVPLGCLKAEAIKFSPPLPYWKDLSIQRLGFGVLNKVVLEFPEVFWDDSIDYFGATAEETDQRGRCFMFWNVKKTVGAPVLIALVVGKAAIDGQEMNSSDHVKHSLLVLRKLYGENRVPDPVASVVTDWGKDPYSYGAYSYVAVGSSGEDYDILGRPVENCLFFAGEATCKEHPDTVGGAMMSGLREAVRIIDILTTGTDYTAEVEAMEDAKRHSDVERSEIRDIMKRLEAVELSSVLCKNSLDGVKILTRESLLRDMFCNANTTAGRLHLAKELLKLPVEVLRSFAGTKEGLSTLNLWMLDSLGKDGTQLLRHCVRLLVLVSTDLLAVRLSGIGKTVKEKVCVHTSRDIRAVASQLVNVWVELFRKEKASNGGLKLLRQSTATDTSKSKHTAASGKPPIRNPPSAVDSKRGSKVSSSAGNHLAFSVNNKKLNVKPAALETIPDVEPSTSQASVGRQNDTTEERQNFPMSEEEKAAFAAAEAARVAALAAAEAYASSGAKCNMPLQLPKIPSFHKFARREQYATMDESDIRRNWPGGAVGRQDCLSEIDSRNCRVRDWSVDFSAAGVNLDSSRMSVDNRSQRSLSNDNACQFNFREHSGESAPVDSNIFTKAWVDSSSSVGLKDYNAIEMWQCQAAAANSDFYDPVMHVTDEEDSNVSSSLLMRKHDVLVCESSASQITVNKEMLDSQPRGAERIKQAVVDYVASLLMPLYKARKLDKDGYKSIMKKTATKVMEHATDAEKAMLVYEFLDFKRKNKIRDFVDTLIERHIQMKPGAKS
ncbi:lysine-specific histone demethylase 1 homolog 3 [Lycium barbarum]|uniref:lysine-specific histone demethylase 1 homolog 3 n=1 Tax=Lycium barbarum TaxID=112863 RepID=UPI00293ECA0B|nr:lysine-specific histone demethylase 1 homolog 3 [Lycium barbarum]XP_060199781.1 lysine-specific histone demethylase 1 homolog 3 [Lycium barbarum]XP_060199782.1 lysine-specific histone demethylase 1 homolog 3 [Lycium barbarum]